MDPNAALRAYDEAMQAHEYDQAEEHARALYSWCAGGGFPPAAWNNPDCAAGAIRARRMMKAAYTAEFNADAEPA